MSDNVRSIGAVAAINHADRVASGLEQLATEIRAGKFRFPVERCAVVLSGRIQCADDFAFAFHGADSSMAEVVGMLELAKLTAATPE